MKWTSSEILAVLDSCAESFTFPALDNGYVYPAASRLSVYCRDDDWSIVIEVFGFSPRSGIPDIHIYTFSNALYNRNAATDYVSEEAFSNYLRLNPHNESRFVYPIENDDWQIEGDVEAIKPNGTCVLRGREVRVPELAEFERCGISLEEDSPLTFEFCRYLAKQYRDLVLCTNTERRISVTPSLELLLQLEEWHHPDVTGGENPSSSESFKQIANAIVSETDQEYRPIDGVNSHWTHWPEGGTL